MKEIEEEAVADRERSGIPACGPEAILAQDPQHRPKKLNIPLANRAQARQDVFDYIEVFYNRQRHHSALNYQSPSEFEEQLRAV